MLSIYQYVKVQIPDLPVRFSTVLYLLVQIYLLKCQIKTSKSHLRAKIWYACFKSTPTLPAKAHNPHRQFFCVKKNVGGLQPVIASTGADKDGGRRDKIRAALHSWESAGVANRSGQQVCSHQRELLRHDSARRGCLSLPNKLHERCVSLPSGAISRRQLTPYDG